jgi:hypothetical protein
LLSLLVVAGCHTTSGTVLQSYDVTAGAPPCQESDLVHCDRFVAASIQLPKEEWDFADPTLQGTPHNQLGKLTKLLTQLQFDWQGEIDAAVASGKEILLIDITSRDPAFRNDAQGKPFPVLGLYAGVAQGKPDFTRNGQFAVDPSLQSSHLEGILDLGTFFGLVLNAPGPLPAVLRLPFGDTTLQLHFAAACIHLPTYATGDPAPFIGGMRTAEVQGTIVPALVARIQKAVQSGADNAALLLQRFDNGGDGSCGVAGDGVIQACEVTSDAGVRAALAPDMPLFAADGTYQMFAPETKQAPNGYSFAIGLNVVPTRF